MIRARENPFRTERLDALTFRPQSTTWDALLTRLHQLDYRAAIVGPHGSGKTTLMEQLVDRIDGKVHLVRITEDDTRFDLPRMEPDDILLFDGADHLPWWRWRLLRRGARRLIVTSHHDGLLPTLIETTTSEALLQELVAELADEDIDTDLIRVLFRRHHGNLRDALFDLYDRYATQSTPSPEHPVAAQTP